MRDYRSRSSVRNKGKYIDFNLRTDNDIYKGGSIKKFTSEKETDQRLLELSHFERNYNTAKSPFVDSIQMFSVVYGFDSLELNNYVFEKIKSSAH